MKFILVNAFLLASLSAFGAPGDVKYLGFSQDLKKGDISLEAEFHPEDPYFKIASIRVEELPVVENVNLFDVKEESLNSNKDLGTIIASLDKLIALGTKIWEIVKKGKPITNFKFAKPISVLPKTEDADIAFTQMDSWSAPMARRYKIVYSNLLGMDVISFDYTVYFQHGGSFEGVGKYLTGLTVRASNVAVSWGFEFNASSELETISNRGASSDPIAAATVRIDYQASSVLRDIQSSESFHATGAGEILKF